MSIGTNIKKRRIELGITQEDLAKAMGYKTRSTIAKIESGENDINQNKLKKIAGILDVSIQELISTPLSTQNTNTTANISNTNKTKTIAVILAGGKSIRNHQNIPNQFLNILGKPVIIYTLEAYQNHPSIDAIYIVCLKGWEQIVNTYAQEYKITKLKGLIPAAQSGILSVKNALEYVSKYYTDSDYIVFQESTRPLINVDMISNLLQTCYEKDSAIICHSMSDHLQFVRNNETTTYINRENTVEIQSPEAYKLNYILNAFDKANQQDHLFDETCCAMLLYNIENKINFIESDTNNIKIIHKEDVAVVSSLLKQID